MMTCCTSPGGRGLPSATTTSVLMKHTTLRHGASTRTNSSECRCTRSSPWRQWWEPAASWISTRTARVRAKELQGVRVWGSFRSGLEFWCLIASLEPSDLNKIHLSARNVCDYNEHKTMIKSLVVSLKFCTFFFLCYKNTVSFILSLGLTLCNMTWDLNENLMQ